ncbi:MAG: L-threonylcarbamoyladenylate synthase [Salibacter sp.]|uniref:L-threonylcarbamoyladenylate synthase n=1 Tax=Salibacter sp. TaxID=2010995 RepID=UPI00287001D1|nr:L-threonylcarbamoyladenylate synthase [Salibacter sp.]MDR9399644.1 L-threonylcarbamoyladenylate synthase [Salibacter sp.]
MIGSDQKYAAELLMQGELVAIPTETVYGLAANALNEDAVINIFEAKQRPKFDPLIVHTHDVSEFEKFAIIESDLVYQLAERFCPGPITFILPKRDIIPDIVTSGHETVGLRIPNHQLTLDLLKRLSFPLAAPSANPFGFTSPTTALHVQNQLGEKIPYILDGGKCEVGIESTIVKVVDDEVEVLRLGGISVEEIESVIGKRVKRVKTSSSNPTAPGMLSSHYNPGVKVEVGDIEKLLSEHRNQKVGILAFDNNRYESFENVTEVKVLSPTGSLSDATQNLFSYLRDFQKSNIEILIAEPAPAKGLGLAINDRLKRAAAK